MLNPARAIVQNSVGNIIYRGNVVTGIVSKNNGNGSYDVYIGESDVAYPNIFTLSRDPDLVVTDKVRILYENGIKEMPIILPPKTATAVIEKLIAVYAYNDGWGSSPHIMIYDADGNYIRQFGMPTGQGELYSGVLCADSNNNVFYVNDNWQTLHKYDINGNLLLTKTIESQQFYRVAIGKDNSVYTLEWDDPYVVRKRNNTTLEIETSQILNVSSYYESFTIDSDGNIFAVNSSEDRIEKWTFGGGMTSSRDINSRAVHYSLAIVGSLIVGEGYYTVDFWTIPTSLNQDITEWSPTEIEGNPWAVGSINGKYLLLGDNIGLFNADKTNVWNIKLLNPIDITAYPF